MTPVNREWLARGKICRDCRVNDHRYRTMWEQAIIFGMDTVDLSQMENGKLDPTPLEEAWGIVPPVAVAVEVADLYAPDLGGEGG